MSKVVAIVGVAHQDVFTGGSRDAAHESVAVSLGPDPHHPRPQPLRNFDRTIGASIVGNDDLASDAGLIKRLLGFPDASFQGLCLVETRHHDGKLDGLGCLHWQGMEARFRVGPEDNSHVSTP